jgi:hypothetical protein
VKLKQELKWVYPYLDSVSHLVPLDKIKEIKLSTYRSSFPSFHGLIETSNHKKYTITVRMYDSPQIPISKLDEETILSHLAHELSHLVHWNDYEVNRFLLETKIYSRFGRTLAKLGYEKDRNKIK